MTAMYQLLFSDPLVFLVVFPGLLLSITIHEFAHAFMADKLGDPTPRVQGRLTLDPRAHLELLGVAMIFFTRFGWGKPVQYDPYNLKEPRRDTALIAIAGPITNLIIATILAMVLKLGLAPAMWLAEAFGLILYINIILAIFNLIPVFPLDGSKILMSIIPPTQAIEYENFMEKYGILVLIALIMPWNGLSPASWLIMPVVNLIAGFLL
jgi:Zn-dependent protease